MAPKKRDIKVLLTTCSYQDTPGKHHADLAASGFEIVRARGPLKEEEMLKLVQDNGGFDGFLNGDDDITEKVISAALAAPRKLKVVAKYGIGLMIACSKHFWIHLHSTKEGGWKRKTGIELAGKTLGVIGMGRIGKEIIHRCIAFGMTAIAFDIYWDEKFAKEHDVKRAESMDE